MRYPEETWPPPEGYFYRVGHYNDTGHFIVYAYCKSYVDAVTTINAYNKDEWPVNRTYRGQKWFDERWVRVYE